MKGNRQKILIADDSEMNRSMLAAMLENEFEILEASNGAEAVAMLHQYGTGISLILLDIVMPVMDGFEVLAFMNKKHWIEDIPVIMISTENAPSYVERAYELGVTDYINRPFDALVVYRRVHNTIMLYAKQKRLIGLVTDQIYEKEKNNSLMINILSHIVEFRNGESGLHVLHINTLTGMLLDRLMQKTDRYGLTWTDRSLITTASALHDIGKIGIDDQILNKPGRLTQEEFEIMKTHSMIGASMLDKLEAYKNEKLVKYAYQICRWHHERYDGRGYPDGLKGEEIPVAAQVVSLADVYDALTSERVYKKAFSHEKAMEMILGGECGSFNPLLPECLQDIQMEVQAEFKVNSLRQQNARQMQNVTEELRRHEDLSESERVMRLLEHERTKYHFFSSMVQEIQFEYTVSPSMLTVSQWGAARMGIKEIVLDPYRDEHLLSVVGRENMKRLRETLLKTMPENPIVQFECEIKIDNQLRWHRIISRVIWSEEEQKPHYMGCIGRMVDIHEEYSSRQMNLEVLSERDTLTGFYNQLHARKRIREILEENQDKNYILMMIDLDSFRSVNEEYGHLFGDQLLRYAANNLHKCVDSDAIEARAGGDEFLIFQECRTSGEEVVKKVFENLSGEYNGFSISVSIGAAVNGRHGRDCESLFQHADQALSAAKREGAGVYRFYNDTMSGMYSAISPIDTQQEHVEAQ